MFYAGLFSKLFFVCVSISYIYLTYIYICNYKYTVYVHHVNHRKSTFSHCLGAPLSLPLTKALCVALDGWATAVAPPLPGAWFSKSFSHGNWTRFAWKLGKELAMEKQPGLMKHGFWFAMMEQLNWKEACLAKTKAMIETRHLKLPSGFLFIDI